MSDSAAPTPDRGTALSLSQQNVSVYMYQFTHDMPNSAMWKAFGDFHASELPYVFDNPVRLAPLAFLRVISDPSCLTGC